MNERASPHLTPDRTPQWPPYLLLALLAACGGSDPASPTDPSGPAPDTRQINAAPSFATDINEIIQRRSCSSSSCHGTAGGVAGLMLTASAANNFEMLVNVDATSEPFKRVLPGDATNSYVVIKLEGRQAVGDPMPLAGAPLDTIDLTNVKNWINNGAPNN